MARPTSTLESLEEPTVKPPTPTNGAKAVDDDAEPTKRYMRPDDMFAISDQQIVEITVPEWRAADGAVMQFFLYSLDASERERYLNSIQYTDKRGRQRFDFEGSNARLLSMSAKTDDGVPLFKGPAALQWLKSRNGAVLERLAKQVREMSGLINEDEDETAARREDLD